MIACIINSRDCLDWIHYEANLGGKSESDYSCWACSANANVPICSTTFHLFVREVVDLRSIRCKNDWLGLFGGQGRRASLLPEHLPPTPQLPLTVHHGHRRKIEYQS